MGFDRVKIKGVYELQKGAKLRGSKVVFLIGDQKCILIIGYQTDPLYNFGSKVVFLIGYQTGPLFYVFSLICVIDPTVVITIEQTLGFTKEDPSHNHNI